MVGVVESSNGFVELGDFVALETTKGTSEGIEGRPGGRGGAKVTLVALLVGLDEPPAIETEPEAAATGSGGFGNANDSEGEKGRTDMGVGTCRSGFMLFR